MQIHDWTRVGPGTFHAFHLRWITHLSDALNGGLLPAGYYADPELHIGGKNADMLSFSPAGQRRTLTIRHTAGHRIIALIEILSPGNKSGAAPVSEFVRKATEAIRAGIHLAVVDLLPPGKHDSEGMHGEIMQALSAEEYKLPEGKPLTFVSYSAGPTPVAYLNHPAVGDEVPDMPLFLTAERYVNLPLGTTYDTTYRGVPAFWREVIEGKRPAPNDD